MHDSIAFSDFQRVELVAGTVTRVEAFPEARNPAWRVWVDFGACGQKKTSARITDLYTPESLLGQQVVGVLNLPPRQIGPMRSEFLLTGFATDQGVVITTTERRVPNGTRLT